MFLKILPGKAWGGEGRGGEPQLESNSIPFHSASLSLSLSLSLYLSLSLSLLSLSLSLSLSLVELVESWLSWLSPG